MIYQIRIKGHVSSQWTDWYEGLTITLKDEGYTLLTGPITDDAALYGILKRVRDLGMQLVSVVLQYGAWLLDGNRMHWPTTTATTSPISAFLQVQALMLQPSA